MLKCSYVILIHNNAQTLPLLVQSLVNIKGDFKKEYIFIEDGSTDDSLLVLKELIVNLPGATIIASEHNGPAIGVNKALSLASGQYVQFVEGDEIIHPQATSTLIEACRANNCQVAVGRVHHDHVLEGEIKQEFTEYSKPTSVILSNNIPELLQIGKAGSLVSKSIVNKIGQCDSEIYIQNMSLSLRLSKYSNFALVEDWVTFKPLKESVDVKFDSYNKLRSIYNFAKNHKEICASKIGLLLGALAFYSIDKKSRLKFLLQQKYSNFFRKYSLEEVLKMYQQEIDRLF